MAYFNVSGFVGVWSSGAGSSYYSLGLAKGGFRSGEKELFLKCRIVGFELDFGGLSADI